MNISAGRFGFKAHAQLQCRTIIAPWVDKKKVITSLKNRDYSSSSLPLRYIPKNSQRNKKFDSSGSVPMKISKRKGIFEIPGQSNQSSNKVSYAGNSVRKSFDHDNKTWHQSKALTDDRDDSMEELSLRGEHSSYSDHSVIDDGQSREDESNNSDVKIVTSQDQNVSLKSFNFDPRTRYLNQTLTSSNFKLDEVEQDNYMEEPFEESGDDNIRKERKDEHSEELVSGHVNYYQQNKSDEDDDLLPFENKTKQEAEKSALKLLARRAYTTFELKKKLCGKKFPLNIIEALINDFQNRGWLSDERYAEAYCQAKWSSSTWGPRRIKQQLSLKGVKNLDSEEAVRVVFKDGVSEDEEKQSLRHGLSKASMDHLLVQASKQWSRGGDLPLEKRKARIARWLQYRGFNWNVVGFVVKILESNHQP